MKLRKNVLAAVLAGLLALTGVACGGDDAGDVDTGVTDTGVPLETTPAATAS